MSATDVEIQQRELRWRQYSLHVELYKFYLDLTLKAVALFFAATGAILGLYLSRPEMPSLRWLLLLPGVIALALTFVFIRGAALLDVVHEEMVQLAEDLQLRSVPAQNVLQLVLRVSAVLLLGTAAGLALLFF